MVEKVDYTTRFERTNRRNIEAANRRVPTDYTPRQKIERKIRPYREGLNRFHDTLSEKTGIASFANKLRNFQQAGQKYRTDKGLGHLEAGWKSPYMRDFNRWIGNTLYNAAEFGGDLFKTGAQALGTAATGIDFIPGDEGIGGEWAKMQGYNPKWETALGDISNPFYDDLKAGEFEMAMGEAERSSGASLLNEKDFLMALGNTNFQNHLRNYGLDLEGVKKEDFVSTLEKFNVDKFFGQFSDEMGTVDVGGKKYDIPQEWMDRYEGYTGDELSQAFDKDMATFSKKEWANISTDYKKGAQKKYTDTLMKKFDFNENELAYAMSKGDPESPFFTDLHKGLWQDIAHENTMPFMPDDFQFEYETPEAEELSTSAWSTAPEWLFYSPMFKGIKKASGIVSKATEGTKAGALNKIYQNMYPGLSGSGGPIPIFNFPSRTFTGSQWRPPYRSQWQFPAATYAASLRETGGE